MPVSAAYRSFIQDLLADFGPVSIRHMFGGAGIYADGVMFAILRTPSISKPTRFRRAPSPPRGKAPSPIVRKAVVKSPYPIGRFPNGCSTTLTSL
jgi:TfoX N-terminal domain